MSVEEIGTDLVVEGNTATVTITRRRELTIDEQFDEDGEFRLREDTAGWNDYLREEPEGGETGLNHVNTVHDEDDWLRKDRGSQQAVRAAVIEHIQDLHPGEPGRFVRAATPPRRTSSSSPSTPPSTSIPSRATTSAVSTSQSSAPPTRTSSTAPGGTGTP